MMDYVFAEEERGRKKKIQTKREFGKKTKREFGKKTKQDA